MKWLATLMPPKFYRYMYHKMVIMSIKFGNTTPYFSCVILMAMSTILQLLCIIFGIGVIIKVNIFGAFVIKNINTINIVFLTLLYIYIHYLLFYYKEKYIKIMEEFEDETSKQTQIGIICLFIYLVFSMFGMFALWGWFITLNNPNYN